MNPKKLGKAFICRLLEAQVKRLRRRHKFSVVTIAGSVGKTSTKLAVARVLERTHPVIYQDGNYNDRLTVPLVLFGHSEPNIYNLLAWLKILISNESIIRGAYPYEVAVLEVGTDSPGQNQKFAYLQPELVILTAIAAEHMEFFGSLEDVAREELVPLTYSKTALLNLDNIDRQFLPDTQYLSYGSSETADYRLVSRQVVDFTQDLDLSLEGEPLRVRVKLLGAQGALALLAAAAVAHIFKLPGDDIKSVLEDLSSAPGRMQLLEGLNNSTIIDDTYNASPIAVKAALDVLYALPGRPRIAILGSMNELGNLSQSEHRQIGEACDPAKLDLVVTIGKDAEQYLAPAAKERGCLVESFLSPIEAGQYVKNKLRDGAVVLAKGSQNGVFAEEAIKLLLKNPADAKNLVRQSSSWLKTKAGQFNLSSI